MNKQRFPAENIYPFTSKELSIKKAAEYIESCHLEDGGYFFARVLPSSNYDTYFAVKTLCMLGFRPPNAESIVEFYMRQIRQRTLSTISGIFTAIEVMREIGQISDNIRKYAQEHILGQLNRSGGFGTMENIYVEVTSELEETYRAVKVLKIIGSTFNELAVINYVSRFLNSDGGYGLNGHSNLASTFYATEIYRLLSKDLPVSKATITFLIRKEKEWQIQFIEELYWLVKSLFNLGYQPSFSERVIEFVTSCQRENGGFARAGTIGIPTIEYTYYAISIFKEMGVLKN